LLDDRALDEAFARMTTGSLISVYLGYEVSDSILPQDGTGFIVPRQAGPRITACTWVHRKWPHMVPDGKALLRCFVGRAHEQEFMNMTDEEIVGMALDDLRKIMKIGKEPEFYRVTRLQNAIPYVVGHQKWVDEVEGMLQHRLPGVRLAGASYRGVGLPDCIDQGKKAVADTLSHLKLGE